MSTLLGDPSKKPARLLSIRNTCRAGSTYATTTTTTTTTPTQQQLQTTYATSTYANNPTSTYTTATYANGRMTISRGRGQNSNAKTRANNAKPIT